MSGLAVKEEEEPLGEQELERHQEEGLVSEGELLEAGPEGRNMDTGSHHQGRRYEKCINVSLSLIPQSAIFVSLIPEIIS